jgi:hypothetical protein
MRRDGFSSIPKPLEQRNKRNARAIALALLLSRGEGFGRFPSRAALTAKRNKGLPAARFKVAT